MRLEDEIKSRFRNQYHKATVNLIYSANWMSRYSNELFKQHGLSAQQFNILRILRGQQGKPASIGTIRERMLEKQSDVSRVVENMRKKGLVDRTNCEYDRRVAYVHLTEAGAEVLSQLDAFAQQMDDRVSNLTEAEVTLLNDLLDKMRGEPAHAEAAATKNGEC